MKILIAEDDLVSRRILNKFLSKYGECDIVIDGLEAINAYMINLKENSAYDLICLDIMMPKADGVKVLKAIRELERQKGIPLENRAKIIMTTAIAESDYVQKAFEYDCDAYASKPINMDRFADVLNKLGFDKKQ